MLRPQIEAYRQSVVQVMAVVRVPLWFSMHDVKQFAGIDAEITGNSNPHAALHLPLFVQGKPIPFSTGSLDKAVERLGQVAVSLFLGLIFFKKSKDSSRARIVPASNGLDSLFGTGNKCLDVWLNFSGSEAPCVDW